MYTIKPTTRFQKDLKRIQKRSYDLSLLTKVRKNLKNSKTVKKRLTARNACDNIVTFAEDSRCREA